MRLPIFLFIIVALFVLSSSAVAADSEQEHLDDARSLYYAGHWDEANEAFEKAHDLADAKSELRAAVALSWGSLLWERGEYDDAQRLVNEALDLARELELDDALGELLATLGHIEASRGELAAAEETLNICIQITEQSNNDVYRALCRLNRRMVRTLLGKDAGSEDEFNADITSLREADSALSMGTSLAKTAEFYRDNRDYDRAAELLAQAHQIYGDVGSVPALTRNSLRKAQLMHRQGKYEESRAHTEGLLEQFEKMRNRPMIVHTLALQAADTLSNDDLAGAVNLYRRALNIAEEIDNPQLSGRVHLAMCELHFDGSRDHCERATEIFEERSMAFLVIRGRTALARAHQNRQEFEEARTMYRQVIAELEAAVDTGDGPHTLSSALLYANLCQVELQLQATGTLTTCTSALKSFNALDDALREDRADIGAATVHAAGRAAERENNLSTAVEHLTRAADLYIELGEPSHLILAADTLLRLGALQSRMRTQRDKVPDTFRKALEITADLATADNDNDQVATTHISLKTQLAQYHLRADDWGNAIEMLTELADFTEKADDLSTAAWAYSGLARAYLQTDRRDEAIEALEVGLPLAERAGDDGLVSTFEENLKRLTE